MKIQPQQTVEKTEKVKMESVDLLTEEKDRLKNYLNKKRERQKHYISKKIRLIMDRIDEDAKFQKTMIKQYSKIIYRRIDEDLQLEEMNGLGKIEENFYYQHGEIPKRPKKVSNRKNA